MEPYQPENLTDCFLLQSLTLYSHASWMDRQSRGKNIIYLVEVVTTIAIQECLDLHSWGTKKLETKFLQLQLFCCTYIISLYFLSHIFRGHCGHDILGPWTPLYTPL